MGMSPWHVRGPDINPAVQHIVSWRLHDHGHSISSADLRRSVVSYRKVPKFSDARNFAVIHLKIKQRGQT